MSESRRAPRRIATMLLTLALLVTLVGVGTPVGAQRPDGQGPRGEPGAVLAADIDAAILRSAPVDLDLRKPSARGLSSELALLVGEDALSLSDAQARAAHLRFDDGRALGDSRVLVQATPRKGESDAAADLLRKLGAEITSVSEIDGRIQAWLPVAALERAGSSPSLAAIRAPQPLTLFENPSAYTDPTQGVSASNANVWHAGGHTGAGIKVAIIDGGFAGYMALLGSHLPAGVQIMNYVDGETLGDMNTGSPHGAACAEIVHDMAPDAELYLVKVATDLDLEQAVTWLRGQNVDVISTSMGWICLTPGDGTGYFDDLVRAARNDGIFWATAAGNERENHWIGGWRDDDGDDILNYNDTQDVNYYVLDNGDPAAIPSGWLVKVGVRWDDWGVCDEDLDLAILRWNGTSWDTIASSSAYQEGDPDDTPNEIASAYTTGDATAYGFIIQHYSGALPTTIDIYNPKGPTPLDERVYGWSIADLGDATYATTVSAVNVASPYPQEEYSSQGPLKGLGGAQSGGSDGKPDIAAYADVNTMSYDDPFNGTSAATPHVAGAAALVLGAFPSYSAGSVWTHLTSHAIDLGDPGPDTLYGAGRLWLGDLSYTAALGGRVMTSRAQPLGVAYEDVELDVDFGSGFVWHAWTVADADGYYRFDALPAGTYHAFVRVIMCDPATSRDVTLSQGQVVTDADIYLEDAPPIGGTDTPTPTATDDGATPTFTATIGPSHTPEGDTPTPTRTRYNPYPYGSPSPSATRTRSGALCLPLIMRDRPPTATPTDTPTPTPTTGLTVGSVLKPYDANTTWQYGPSGGRYGAHPEIVVAANGLELDVYAQDYDDATAWRSVLLHLAPAGNDYVVTQALNNLPELDNVMGMDNDASGNRYYASGISEAGVVDPYYPPLDTYRSNIVRVFKVNAGGGIVWDVDLDLARNAHTPGCEQVINPMVAASARLCVGGDEVALVHGINTTPDWNINGSRHQKALSTRLNATTGAIERTSSIWVSHSFDQRLMYDGQGIIENHLGDAYPRTVVFGRDHRSYPLFHIKGGLGDNTTRTRLGNVALIEQDSAYGYIALFVTENSTGTSSSVAGPRNLAIVRVNKNDNSLDPSMPDTLTVDSCGTSRTNRLRWLTHYTSGQNLHAERPKLVGVGGDRYIVLYEEWSASPDTFHGVKAMLIDAQGNIQRGPTSITSAHHLHRGDDAFRLGDSAGWMTGDGEARALDLHLVDANLAYRRITIE